MYTIKSKEQLIDLINKADYINTEIEYYRTGYTRDSYFDRNSDIYESIKENPDDIHFHVDFIKLLRDNYSYNHNSSLEAICNVINNNELLTILKLYIKTQQDINNVKFIEDNLEEFLLSELEKYYPLLYRNIINLLDNLTSDDVTFYGDSAEVLFDCEDVYNIIDNATFESLAYWTVYYSPSYSNEDIAIEVGLTPFEYKGDFYLALGGCGMDLSPKLDAYVALAYKVIPKDSNFFRDKSYFKYVVGDEVYDKIERLCRLENPKYIVEFNCTKEV